MKISELIDRAMRCANIDSYYALAKVLGIPNGWISEYKSNPPKRHPSVEIATKLAILAKVPEMEVIAQIELQTAKTEEKKKFWRHYIESRGIAATFAMTALAASIILCPSAADAGALQFKNYGGFGLQKLEQANIHYAINKSKERQPVRPDYIN